MSDEHAELPSPQNFAGRLRGQAAFLAANYTDLSDSETQVIVRALESAADHVEAYLHVGAASEVTVRAGMEVLRKWKETDEYDERKLVTAIFEAMRGAQVKP